MVCLVVFLCMYVNVVVYLRLNLWEVRFYDLLMLLSIYCFVVFDGYYLNGVGIWYIVYVGRFVSKVK